MEALAGRVRVVEVSTPSKRRPALSLSADYGLICAGHLSFSRQWSRSVVAPLENECGDGHKQSHRRSLVGIMNVCNGWKAAIIKLSLLCADVVFLGRHLRSSFAVRMCLHTCRNW
jgi:hypothetical protein